MALNKFDYYYSFYTLDIKDPERFGRKKIEAIYWGDHYSGQSSNKGIV